MTGQRLKPMGMGDIFDEGFDLYKRNLSFFVLVSALVIVPGLIIQQIIRSMMGTNGGNVTLPPSDPSALLDWLGTNLSTRSPLITSGVIAYILSFGALICATSARYIEWPITTGAIYMTLLRRMVKLLVVCAIVTLVVCIGFGLCMFPGLIAFVFLLFSAHCVMIENPKFLSGLNRSWTVVKGYGWRTFGFLIMLYLLYAILNLALVLVTTYVLTFLVNMVPGAGAAFGIASNVGGVNWNDGSIGLIASSLAGLFVTPFIVSVLTVYYYDLRVRNEAYDVLSLARELNYPPLSELTPYLPSAMPPTIVSYTQPGRVPPNNPQVRR